MISFFDNALFPIPKLWTSCENYRFFNGRTSTASDYFRQTTLEERETTTQEKLIAR